MAMLPALQSRFSDLYSVVYDLIDDAKKTRALVKLYKGSHGADNPHPVVPQVGEYFFRERRGLLAFLCQESGAEHMSPRALERYDAARSPRIPSRDIYKLFAESSRHAGETDESFLRRVASREHRLGWYRGGSSGFDDEARACLAAHFGSTGISAHADEILVCCGGAKGAFLSLCAAVMCRHERERVHRMSGRILAPAGYYQSLRVLPPVVGGTIDVVDTLSGRTVSAWLADTARVPGTLVYVPLVNNFDGRVLIEDRARAIAEAVLQHNRRHPRTPVYVLGDDVYAGSYLTTTRARPIGSITGTELGHPELGNMADWTLSVATPSKTFALPTSRVAFAHTTNPALRSAVNHYRTMLSYGRVPQGDELTAAAAICLTPQQWIDDWNRTYARRVDWLSARLQVLNHELGVQAFGLCRPEGGWYTALRIHPRLFPLQLPSSVHALAVCLHYGGDQMDSGVGLLPGELAGYRLTRDTPEFVLRASVAVTDSTLDTFVRRLADLARRVTGPDGHRVIAEALNRARSVVPDLDTIVTGAT
ncbi:hypothetical protein GCM10025787_29680 [Saccharopolyspora rosea]|uniref:Pyridoxal phosphate-dependent aminotransferase n=1 Tax=Saccharopolyspora rosea TaxID=524884 RepID=A0ABW3G1A4_9PSEU